MTLAIDTLSYFDELTMTTTVTEDKEGTPPPPPPPLKKRPGSESVNKPPIRKPKLGPSRRLVPAEPSKCGRMQELRAYLDHAIVRKMEWTVVPVPAHCPRPK